MALVTVVLACDDTRRAGPDLAVDAGPVADGSLPPLGPDPRPPADKEGNVIPDFSRVGYKGGGVAIPDVPTVRELSPQPSGDDTDRIQSALDAIGRRQPDENEFRGALLLKAGEYRVSRHLNIRHSGVVLRGEGQSREGRSSSRRAPITTSSGETMSTL